MRDETLVVFWKTLRKRVKRRLEEDEEHEDSKTIKKKKKSMRDKSLSGRFDKKLY